MKEIELLLELGDLTEIEFFLDTLRDMRGRVGDTEVLNRIMEVCHRIIERHGGCPFPAPMVQQLKHERDALLIKSEFEKYKNQEEARKRQAFAMTQQQLTVSDMQFQKELAKAIQAPLKERKKQI